MEKKVYSGGRRCRVFFVGFVVVSWNDKWWRERHRHEKTQARLFVPSFVSLSLTHGWMIAKCKVEMREKNEIKSPAREIRRWGFSLWKTLMCIELLVQFSMATKVWKREICAPFIAMHPVWESGVNFFSFFFWKYCNFGIFRFSKEGACKCMRNNWEFCTMQS